MLGQICEEASVGSCEQLSNFFHQSKNWRRKLNNSQMDKPCMVFLLHFCFRLGFTGRMKMKYERWLRTALVVQLSLDGAGNLEIAGSASMGSDCGSCSALVSLTVLGFVP